jgi:histone H3/H4
LETPSNLTATRQEVSAPILISGSISGSSANYSTPAVALREIRRYQKSADRQLRFTPFSRLIQEICITQDVMQGVQFQHSAIEILREAAERFVVSRFNGRFLSLFLS